MIIRFTTNAAVHSIGGAILGITVVLAACTVAQAAASSARRRISTRGTNEGPQTLGSTKPAN